MIHIEELRSGNRVFWNPGLITTNMLIQVEITSLWPGRAGYIRSHLEHRAEPFEDELVTTEIPSAKPEELEPIPLTAIFMEKLATSLKYPDWIKYVHELQNWYYWSQGKKELEIND